MYEGKESPAVAVVGKVSWSFALGFDGENEVNGFWVLKALLTVE
jgi:hypothetical protein